MEKFRAVAIIVTELSSEVQEPFKSKIADLQKYFIQK